MKVSSWKMSVSVAMIHSPYASSRLGVTNCHHNHQIHLQSRFTFSPEVHVVMHEPNQCKEQPRSSEGSQLHFSVVNILRPDFGHEAILNTRSSSKTTSIRVSSLPAHSPVSLLHCPRRSSSQLLPHLPHRNDQDSLSCVLTSAFQDHSSNLSRSGSLESLASSRSSVTGGSINGATAFLSTTSIVCNESLSIQSTNSNSFLDQNSGKRQSIWPAWIYCTRYSDRPSSGKYLKVFSSFDILIYLYAVAVNTKKRIVSWGFVKPY